MKPKIAALLIAAVVLAIVIGARLGGWGDKTSSGPLFHPDVTPVPAPVAPPLPPAAAPATSSPPVAVVPPAPPPPVEKSSTPPAAVGKPSAPVVAAQPPAAPPKPPDDYVEKVRQEIDEASLMFRDYRTLMGQNPVGTNAEIMHQINGGNPKGARLMREGQQINGNGELVDQWGTPYFFHQMSATHMDITSAGPDRKLGTADDVTGR